MKEVWKDIKGYEGAYQTNTKIRGKNGINTQPNL